jgi:hypothetical protein
MHEKEGPNFINNTDRFVGAADAIAPVGRIKRSERSEWIEFTPGDNRPYDLLDSETVEKKLVHAALWHARKFGCDAEFLPELSLILQNIVLENTLIRFMSITKNDASGLLLHYEIDNGNQKFYVNINPISG